MFCAQDTIERVTEFTCLPSEQKMSHYTSVFPRLPWGILGLPLSFIGSLSPLRMVSLDSFSEQDLHWLVTVITDPSQMVSFLDWCLSFLHETAGHSTCRSSWDLTENYVSQSWISQDIFWAASSYPWDNRCYNPVNVSSLQCSWAVGQLLKSWLVTSSILVKACGFTVNIRSWMSGSWLLAVDSWSSCHTGTDEPHKVFNYHSPCIGHQVLSWVFLSYSLG